MDQNIPVKKSRSGRYQLLESDKKELLKKAVGGVVPLWDYIAITTKIINRNSL